MKTYNLLIVLSLLLVCNNLQSQDALTMQDLNFDPASYNSAFIAQAPKMLNASLTTSLGNGVQNTSKVNFLAYANIQKYGFGVGLKLNSKFFGLFETNTAEFLYSKTLKINNDHNLYAGMNIGMHFSGLDQTQFTSYVNLEDPFITENALPQYRLTTGVGLGYTFKDKIIAGFSMPSFLKNKNEFFPAYVFNSSYRHKLPSEISLIPQVLLSGTEVSAMTFEGNITIDYKDYLWLKLGGRTTNSLVMGLGWNVKFVTVSYNYNLNFAEYAEINPGIHNVNVRLNFNRKKDQRPAVDFRNDMPDRKEMNKQLALLESINVAHEEDKKELETLIKKMESLLADVEKSKQQAKIEEQKRKEEERIRKNEQEQEDAKNEAEQEEQEIGNAKEPVISPVPVAPIVPTTNNYKYYVVVASLKDPALALNYKQLLDQEYDMETNITQNDGDSWQFIYSFASNDLAACKAALRSVKWLKNKKYIKGVPWIYAK